jgi:NADPH:quinone reductase-like Zn-dependent oxidoreductase
VIVRVHAAGFTTDELSWTSAWADRARRDRTPSIPGANVIGTGRATHRAAVLELGANDFVDLEQDRLEDVGQVDVLGGATRDRSAALVRDGGALVTIADPPTVRPANARAVFFVVEPDRQRLADLADRVRRGELRPLVARVVPLSEAPTAVATKSGTIGRTIIQI